MRAMWMCGVVALCSCAPAGLLAQTEPASGPTGSSPEIDRFGRPVVPVMQAVRISGEEPRIDGKLDDAAWEAASVVTGFVQFAPDPGTPASQRTEARVLYGDEALYVAIRAFDTAMDSVAAQLTRRDQSSYSDEVGFIVDSYFDRRTAFHFQVNPLGVKTDVYRFEDTQEDLGWDAVWEVGTSMDDEGWSAEFRIPLSQLRFRDAPDQTWGINFLREIARHDEIVAWAPTSRNDAAIVSRLGELRGIRNLKPPRRLEVAPYTLARLERAPGNEANPFYSKNQRFGTVGADVKYGITSDLTLNVTLNPDFGQVEADPAQVNLSAYETFFPERRPFFVEGANLFNFSLALGDGDDAVESLFYSRRVGRPPQGRADAQGGFVDAENQTTIIGATKLSGKTASGWSIGLLNAITAEERATVAPAQGNRLSETVEPLSSYTVGRVQRDFREGRTAVGFIGTGVNRNGDIANELGLRTSAYAGGVDVRHRFGDDRFVLQGYFVGSHIRGSEEAITSAQLSSARYYQRPDASHIEFDPTRTSLSGFTGSVTFNKITGGHWRFGTGVQTRSPGFDTNDAGFLRESDFTVGYLYAGYDQSSPQGPFRRWRLNANAWRSYSYGGELYNTGGNVNGSFQFANFWSGYAGVNRDQGGLSNSLLRGGPAMRREGMWNGWAGLNTDARKALLLNVNNWWNVRPESDSWTVGLSPSVRWRPSGRATVSVGATVSKSVEDRQWIGRIGSSDDPTYLFGRLEQTTVGLTGRVDLAFSPTLSLQIYAQPFVSAGDYGAFKRVEDPRADLYADRFTGLQPTLGENGRYTGDLDGDGDDESFGSPDFSFRQFRSNTVLRWEYRPGSTLFLVWAQGRNGYDPTGGFDFNGGMDRLFNVHPSNTFMLKMSYWFAP